MKLMIPNCPKCGAVASGLVEHVICSAWISEDESEPGEFDYVGESEMHWDTQESIRDEEGKLTAICDNSHEWQTEVQS